MANKAIMRPEAAVPASNPAAPKRTPRKPRGSAEPITAPVSRDGYRARIRMYRQAIGDAFLLSFNTSPTPSHILIDCGVLTGTPNGKEWAQRIAENVEKETGGHVNAIVGSHPHWDHLSGFHDAEEVFKRLKVDEVWLSWAENPADAKAQELKRGQALQLDAVRRALTQLAAASDPAIRTRAAAIEQILSFQGPSPILGAAGLSGTDAALDSLRKLVAHPNYWEPGDLIMPYWLPAIRIYVLAPPREDKLLSKMLGKTGSEMYRLGSDSGFYAALLAQVSAVPADAASTASALDTARPFDASLCWNKDQARKDSHFASVMGRYEDPRGEWRTTENDWLLSAEQMALQFDRVVNNFSLVLAFEFTKTGEVLLFPADAQIGNWLSWQTLTWPLKDDRTEKSVQSNDLLRRTVFYKVGHHGSHNATLMNAGLEAMVNPELVAAIPVNEAFANNTKKWEMPGKSLYSHLVEKTKGRILRSDGIGPTATKPADQCADTKTWTSFTERVFADPGESPLYVDYFLP